MPVELRMLGWAVVLGLVYIVVATGFGTWVRGLLWNFGNRGGEPLPLNAFGERAQRASRNFLETFVFFAAATLAVVLANKTGPSAVMAAELYLWARVAYLPIYILGIPYLRTLVWAISMWGIVQMLVVLLH